MEDVPNDADTGEPALQKTILRPLQHKMPDVKLQEDQLADDPQQRHTWPQGEGLEPDSGNLADLVSGEAIRAAQINHRSRVCFVGTEPSNFNYLVRQTSSQTGRDGIFHFSNRQYHLKYTSHDIERVPREALERPAKPVIDKLVRAYFVHVNRGWPIVDEENFLNQLEGGDAGNPLSLPLLNAVLLVGAHVLSFQEDFEQMRLLQSLLFRRTKALMDCRYEQDRQVYVQVALLLTWYSDGLEEVVANAWHWIGTAARTATGLGMHRDTTTARLLDVHRRSWIRLWWVLFQFDTLISLSNLDDCGVPDLEYAHFQDIREPEADFVIHQTRLCVIISRTLRQRWALRASSEQRTRATNWADQALASFTMALPPSLQLPLANAGTWRAILHLTYNNFVLLLHRPPPKHRGEHQPSQPAGNSDICAEASMGLVSLLEGLHCTRRLYALSLFDVQAVFTAIVAANNELHSSNPLVVAKASQKLKSMSAILAELARNWGFARGLLRIFDSKGELTLHRATKQSVADPAQRSHECSDRCDCNGASFGGMTGGQDSASSCSTTARNGLPFVGQAASSVITPSDTAYDSPGSLVGEDRVRLGNPLDDFVFPGAFELEEFLLGENADFMHF
ncbi:acetamidase regulatory protein [Metarhizium album ARSEF 1941]|uniref:Acetamidase regulatory protein n=1 Tax=Metarhizium album (strain ARSEF 1941) TaxID=1081103 RepID=A0A0B2WXA7_METAS|nr:acetamidase regulatory protein [Metarhizium album ARSEF 1941]KHN97505.1 acetamidase regulatory protein [Metarhizium album ARSEF 1941]